MSASFLSACGPSEARAAAERERAGVGPREHGKRS